ncbi:uncharacterized protein [Henckelia pumila]|uniref:uncharacterized protein n=1 Tax=Henckelia pumila TaxID=405737 RepID=UPI003C6E0269
MDPEEIAKRVGRLKLSQSNNEAPRIISKDQSNFGQQKLDSCLVGKVFSAKVINRETFRVQMPRILQAKNSVKIKVIGENLLFLDFASMTDRRRALMDGPWTFFKDLIVFKAPMGLQKSTDMVFDEIPVWVQCHNVPLAFMQDSIIRNIAEGIGRVIEIDSEEDGRCSGKFARVRVILDITKPLRQGIWVKTENMMEEICILLLYERLPNFCFKCGRLGHMQRDYEEKTGVEYEPPFGNWIRALPFSGDRKFQSSKSNSSDSTETPSMHSKDGLENSDDVLALFNSPQNGKERGVSHQLSELAEHGESNEEKIPANLDKVDVNLTETERVLDSKSDQPVKNILILESMNNEGKWK